MTFLRSFPGPLLLCFIMAIAICSVIQIIMSPRITQYKLFRLIPLHSHASDQMRNQAALEEKLRHLSKAVLAVSQQCGSPNAIKGA